jgi:hypothetical protein
VTQTASPLAGSSLVELDPPVSVAAEARVEISVRGQLDESRRPIRGGEGIVLRQAVHEDPAVGSEPDRIREVVEAAFQVDSNAPDSGVAERRVDRAVRQHAQDQKVRVGVVPAPFPRAADRHQPAEGVGAAGESLGQVAYRGVGQAAIAREVGIELPHLRERRSQGQ